MSAPTPSSPERDNLAAAPGDLPETPLPEPADAAYAALPGTPGLVAVAEALLKEPSRIVFELSRGRCLRVIALLVGIIVVCLLAYGVTVGLFSGDRQLWAAPVKITAGSLLTMVICFPSLAIFSCLAGARVRMPEVLGALVSLVALYSILLLGFAPVSWVFSQATNSVAFMGSLHLVFWAIGLYYGFRFFRGLFRKLDGRRAGHLTVWGIIFVMVSLQMVTFLRPIIGSSGDFLSHEKKFFVVHWQETIEGETRPVEK
ncbi:MAG: hypothetical protein AB1486_21675 [Planctomycetota bacterium]